MPRRNHNAVNCPNQRSNLPADRERKRRLSKEVFSASRPLSSESADMLGALALDFARDAGLNYHFYDEKPETNEAGLAIRRLYSVTHISAQDMRRSLYEGIHGGYELGKAIAQIHQRTEDTGDGRLIVPCESIDTYGNRRKILAVSLELTPVLEEEHAAIVSTLGKLGVKGVERGNKFRPHVSVYEARNLKKVEREELADAFWQLVEAELPEVELEPISLHYDP